MENVLPLLLTVILILLGAIAFRMFKGDRRSDSALLLQNQLEELRKTIDAKIGETTKLTNETVRHQFSESQKIIKEVVGELTRVSEGQKRVLTVTDELQSLKNILQNPKQRGVLGEYYLQSVLENVLPPNRFQLQYSFKDGEIVDAVIFLQKDQILPVDSKFSLENYNRLIAENDAKQREDLEKKFKQDLKMRIDETAKYIRPKEGTMDFAFMFIPSEAIYYDLLVNKVGTVKTSSRDLIEYAFRDKRVIIVSPTSFLAYLQTVQQGLRSLQIEESAKVILKGVESLGRHLKNYDQHFVSIGKSLNATVNHYDRAQKELGKIDKDVTALTDTSAHVTELPLERPKLED